MIETAFDGSLIGLGRMDGINRYSLALLKRFDPATTVFIANRQVANAYTLPNTIECPQALSVPGTLGNLLRLFWKLVILPWHLLTWGPRVYFSPTPEGQALPVVKQMLVVHDLLPFRYPATYPRLRLYVQLLMPWWLGWSRHVVVVSRATQRDLQRWYPWCGPSTVVYEGSDVEPKTSGLVHYRFPFVLLVGEQRPYKNLSRAIQAFALMADDTDLKLLIVGKASRLNAELFGLPGKLGIESRVVFTGFVEEQKLADLYHQARFFVFPSLYEGFGLPLLEAMAAGCLVAASRNSSIPEVCAEAALYFNPLDTADMARAMRELNALALGPGRVECQEAARTQAQKFSFDLAYAQISQLLKAL